MKISFQIDKKDSQFTTFLLETFPSYVFIMEILLNFNTAYYHKGIIHTSRKQIIKYYLARKFFWDLIVVVPFMTSQFNIPYTDFTVILRVARVKGMVEQLEQVLNMRENYQAIFDLIKLIYFMLFISHFCACAWHYLAIIEVDVWNSSNSWLRDNGLESLPWVQRYIASFYWSIITILTVGYGDITPVTDYERVFVIFVALIICGAFGYSISAVGQIIQRLEEKKNIQRAKLKIINQHIQKRGLNQALQLKVRKYFEYYFKLEEEENSKAELLMSQLTRRLKEEVLADIYYKVLKGSRFLGKNFSKEFLNQLCPFLKERKYAPEEDIFSRGEVAQKLIFILSGEVQIYAAGQTDADKIVETNFRTYKQGFVIGEREFCTNRMFEYNARAVRFTQVALLDFEDFHRVISENEEDFEKFCLLRDNLTFNQNYKIIGRVCEICQSSHSFQRSIKNLLIRCPFVFFQPNQAKILTKFRSTKNQTRKSLHHRHNGKSQVLSCVTDIQEAALAFITTNKFLPVEQLSDEYLEKLGFKLIQPDVLGSPSFKSSSMRTDDFSSLQKEKEKAKMLQTMKRKKATNLLHMVNHLRERQMTQDTPEHSRKKSSSVRNLDYTKVEDIDDDYSDESHLMIKMPSLYRTEFKERYQSNNSETQINDNGIVVKKLDGGPFLKQFSLASQESAIYDRPLDTPSRFKLMQYTEDKSHKKRRSIERYKSIIQSEYVKVLKRNPSTVSAFGEQAEQTQQRHSKQEDVKGFRDLSTERRFQYDAPQQNPSSPVRNSNLMINHPRGKYEHVDFDIDRQKSFTRYFPLYNLENIMKKTQPVKEITATRQLKISQGQSTNPFDRIKTMNNIKSK